MRAVVFYCRRCRRREVPRGALFCEPCLAQMAPTTVRRTA